MKRIILSLAMTTMICALAGPICSAQTNNPSSSTSSSSASSSSSYLPACNGSGTDTNGAPTGGEANGTLICTDANSNSSNGAQNIIIRLIADVINVLSVIVGIASIIIIIVSAIRLVAGGSDANNAAEARRGIIAAVIGIFIVALAQTIVIFVLDNIK